MRALVCGLTLVSALAGDLLHEIEKDDCSDETCSMSLLQLQASKVESFLESTAITDCSQGIKNKGKVCCAKSCGKCGGRKCSERPGGADACCDRKIRRAGKRCRRPDQVNCIIRKGRGKGRGDGEDDVDAPIPDDIRDEGIVEEMGVCDAPIDFTQASVIHSNLGGAGPDSGDETLVFGNVMPGTNLVISATSPYTPNTVNAQGGILRNDIKNGFGAVNLASGSSVDLQFQFQAADSGQPKVLEQFLFTFFDADHGMAHESREAMTVSGFSSFKYTEETALDVTETSVDNGALVAGAGVATFTSTMRGGKVDNPTNPLALTDLQARRAVTLLFENKAEFTVSAGESGYANPQGRNIFFAGASSLVCTPEAKCSSYKCPDGFGEKQDAEFEVCATKPCTAADTIKCCTAAPPARAGQGGNKKNMGMGMGNNMGSMGNMGMGMGNKRR